MKAFVPALVLLLGCQLCGADKIDAAKNVHASRPAVQMIVLDESLEAAAGLWEKELGRRFSNAVAIICHGGDLIEGEWMVKVHDGDHVAMRADELVKHYQALYPDRQVVLLACNPGHLKLNVPGVFYAHSSVWTIPDRNVIDHQAMQYLTIDGRRGADAGNRADAEPDVIGNAFELICE